MNTLKDFFYHTRFFWYGALFHSALLIMMSTMQFAIATFFLLSLALFLPVYFLDKKYVERKL